MNPEKKYSSIFVVFSFLKFSWNANKVDTAFFLLFPIFFGLLPIIDAYLFKLIIDFFSIPNSNFTNLIYLILALFLLRVLDRFIHDLHNFFYTRLKDSLTPFVIGKIVDKISKLKYEQFENPDVITLIEKVKHNSDYRPVQMLLRIPITISFFVTFLSSIFGIFIVGWWVIPIILIGLVPDIIFSRNRMRADYSISDRRSPLHRQYSYLESLSMRPEFVKEIGLFDAHKRLWSKMKAIFDQFTNQNKEISRKYLFLDSVSQVTSTISFGVGFVYLAYITYLGKITVGSLTFNLSLMNSLSESSYRLFNEILAIQDDVLYLKDFFILFDLEEETFSGTKLEDFTFKEIKFENVSFRYPGSKKYVLKNINLSIKKGEKIAFVGENGAGKTTLIKLLLRFYKPESGMISLDDKDINTIDRYDWYKLFGVLFQDYVKFEFTARENIEFGNPDLNDEKLFKSSVDKADATELINSLRDKENTLLSKMFDNGVNLSGGQWQRIALARMYYRNSEILILDEPTASIDAESEARIFDIVQSLSKDKTVFIISHRFSTVRRADRILVLHEGKILEEGSHQKLLSENGKYARMFNLQASGYV